MATKTRMSVEEFLKLPETKPYRELIDGEVVAKSMPNKRHSRVVSRLITRLGTYLERTGEGDVDTELRHAESDEDWVFLPDISVTVASRVPPLDQNPVEIMPDMAIEVLSPDDRPGRVSRRVDFFLRNGVRLVWIVDPVDETVTVYRPGEYVELYTAPAQLRAMPILS
jgi:Uma2 family endonuclease